MINKYYVCSICFKRVRGDSCTCDASIGNVGSGKLLPRYEESPELKNYNDVPNIVGQEEDELMFKPCVCELGEDRVMDERDMADPETVKWILDGMVKSEENI